MTSFRENSSNGLINKDIENGDFLSKRKLERKKYHADLFALGQEIMRCINGNNIEEAKKKFDEFTIKISPEIKLNLNLYIKRIRDDKYKEFGNIGTHIDYESCLDESLQEYYLYLWKYRDKRFDRLFNQDFPSNITRLILNDTKRIFVLGHSLGGMLIPRIGTLDSSVAGFIILAGTSRPLEDVILEQMSYFISLTEAAPETRKKQLDQLKEQVKRVKDPKLSLSTPSAGLPFGVPAAYWLDLRGYNPPEVAKNLKQPILILQGGRDYQVTMEDFEGWERALSLRKNVEFKVYPALNHLFIEGKGKGTPAEYEIPGHVAEVVIDDVAWWIKKY